MRWGQCLWKPVDYISYPILEGFLDISENMGWRSESWIVPQVGSTRKGTVHPPDVSSEERMWSQEPVLLSVIVQFPREYVCDRGRKVRSHQEGKGTQWQHGLWPERTVIHTFKELDRSSGEVKLFNKQFTVKDMVEAKKGKDLWDDLLSLFIHDLRMSWDFQYEN